jgi:hypothetical protein
VPVNGRELCSRELQGDDHHGKNEPGEEPGSQEKAEVVMNRYLRMEYIRSPLRRNDFTRSPSFLRK